MTDYGKEDCAIKTVQEYLKEADEKRIMDEYFYVHPIDYEQLRDKTELSIKEVRERVRDNFKAYIKRLQRLPIQPTEDTQTHILYAHNIIKEEGYKDVSYSLIHLKELNDKGHDAPDYAYNLSNQEEIMGYFVADTDFTQKHLYGLLADVLFEASFFGVEQEHLAEERRKLDESIKEIEEGKCVTYSMDEFREHLGLEKEDVDEEADGLWHKLAEATFAYERYCRNKELDKLKESIME